MTNTISKVIHNGDEFEFDTSSVSGITTTQPSNPSEGAVYYDTTNDVVKVYDGTNWNVVGDDTANINTKTFFFSGNLMDQSNLETALSIIDWLYDGDMPSSWSRPIDKNPIVVYNDGNGTYNKAFHLEGIYDYSGGLHMVFERTIGNVDDYHLGEIGREDITLSITGHSTSNIALYYHSNYKNFLPTTNNISYTPSGNYNPATKKYVDDTVASAKSSGATAPSNPTEGQLWYDTTNDVLKVYDGTNWVEVGGGATYTAGTGISIGNIAKNGRQGPSPDGFHVPSKDEWVALCGVLTNTFSMASNATTMGTYLKMPMAGLRRYNDANIEGVGTAGNYWSSTPNLADSSYYLWFNSSYIRPQVDNCRAEAFSIRSFKDSPVTPDSSWTILYQGSGSAGVFRNSSLGLISVSGDGTTWYTIMDKNLGATTVFNQGDTVNDANGGYFYQWGNNYGFPHSGIVTHSANQIDASDYGPNTDNGYYSSDTFITGVDWSSVQNDDLWGDTTGTYTQENAIINTGVLSVNGQTGDVTVPAATVISGDSGTTYTIKVSNSAPASGTPNSTITFVI